MRDKQQITEADIKTTKRKRFEDNGVYLTEFTRMAGLFDTYEKKEPLFNDLTPTEQQAKLERDKDTKPKKRQTAIAEHFEFAILKSGCHPTEGPVGF